MLMKIYIMKNDLKSRVPCVCFIIQKIMCSNLFDYINVVLLANEAQKKLLQIALIAFRQVRSVLDLWPVWLDGFDIPVL